MSPLQKRGGVGKNFPPRAPFETGDSRGPGFSPPPPVPKRQPKLFFPRSPNCRGTLGPAPRPPTVPPPRVGHPGAPPPNEKFETGAPPKRGPWVFVFFFFPPNITGPDQRKGPGDHKHALVNVPRFSPQKTAPKWSPFNAVFFVWCVGPGGGISATLLGTNYSAILPLAFCEAKKQTKFFFFFCFSDQNHGRPSEADPPPPRISGAAPTPAHPPRTFFFLGSPVANIPWGSNKKNRPPQARGGVWGKRKEPRVPQEVFVRVPK